MPLRDNSVCMYVYVGVCVYVWVVGGQVAHTRTRSFAKTLRQNDKRGEITVHEEHAHTRARTGLAPHSKIHTGSAVEFRSTTE